MLRVAFLLILIESALAIHVSHVSDCGKSRGCWLLPNGCKNSSDCSVIVTWKHTGRALVVEMEAALKVEGNGAWLALGISKDDIMGNDTVLECRFPKKGKGSVGLSHNLRVTNEPLPEATQMLLKDSYTEERDGRALCGAEWMLDNTMLEAKEKKLMHRITSGKYNLLFAFGELDKALKKKSHEIVGDGAPWRSIEQTRFCNHCTAQIVDE